MSIFPTEEEKFEGLEETVNSLKERIRSYKKMDEELIIVQDTKGGYTVFFKEIPDVISEGETIDEAYHNLILTIHDIVKSASQNISHNREAIIEAYQSGLTDGENEMYNSDYAGSREQEKPIEGEEDVVKRIMKTYL